MPFYLYAWIATISFGFVVVIVKFASKYSISNPWLFNFLTQLILTLLLIPTAIYYRSFLPSEWLFLGISSVFNAIWVLMYVFSLYKLDVSVFTPLYNFRVIFAVLFGFFLLGETLALYQLALFCVIIIGGLFVSIDEKLSLKSFFNKSIGLAIVAMLFLVLSNIYAKKTLAVNDVWEVALWTNVITTLFLIPTIPKFRKDIGKLGKKQIPPLVLMGLASVIGTIFVNLAYQINVGVTAIILAIPTSMILAVGISIFIPGFLEKHTNKVYAIRFTAAAAMIVAALLISL
ncbi:MAG: DMT family transporter [Candidatus Woykebacteria bacterium]